MSDKTTSARAKFLLVIVVAMAIIFVLRLFYLQIIQYSYYKDLADQTQIKQRVIPAQRGLIYAMDGDNPVVLVSNQTVYTVFADPPMVTDKAKVVSTIQADAGDQARDNLTDLLNNTNSRYQILATKVPRSAAEKIKSANLAGIGFQANSQRVYPEGALAGQLLGFVDANGDGQYGVEGGLNSELSGTDGVLKSVTDVNSVPLTLGNQNIDKPAVNGKNVVLSIDRNIQAQVEQTLAQELDKYHLTEGSVIVMNPQNGQVMAMANLPSYDPSQFNLVTDPALFNNDVISDPYEPGSVIKTLTMATALDTGKVGPNDTYNNTDHITVDDATIQNFTKGHTGNITIQEAMNYSLNTGFVTVAERLGDGKTVNQQARNTMYDYFYNHFRIGQLTGIELAGESPGFINKPNSAAGGPVTYATMAFGQAMDATVLQVATAFSAGINGGNYYKPSVVAGTMDDNGNYTPSQPAKPIAQVISSNASNTLRQMVLTTRQANGGKNIDTPGYVVGGKTGTAQVPDPNGGYYGDRTIGSYIGFGGDDTPRYVIMVRVPAPTDVGISAGTTTASHVFTDISNWLLNYLKIAPKN